MWQGEGEAVTHFHGNSGHGGGGKGKVGLSQGDNLGVELVCSNVVCSKRQTWGEGLQGGVCRIIISSTLVGGVVGGVGGLPVALPALLCPHWQSGACSYQHLLKQSHTP